MRDWEKKSIRGSELEQCQADLFLADLLCSEEHLPHRRSGESWHPARSYEQVTPPESMIVRSRLRSPGFYRIPRIHGHYFARPLARTWGQLALILFLARLSARWATKEPGYPFGLGDLANEDGSVITDHRSHTTGVAADIYVINRTGLRRGWDAARGRPTNTTVIGGPGYDPSRTQRLALLIKEVIESGFPAIQVLFNDTDVQQAVGKSGGRMLIQTDAQRCGLPFPRPDCTNQHYDHFHILLQGRHPHSSDQVRALLGLVWYADF